MDQEIESNLSSRSKLTEIIESSAHFRSATKAHTRGSRRRSLARPVSFPFSFRVFLRSPSVSTWFPTGGSEGESTRSNCVTDQSLRFTTGYARASHSPRSIGNRSSEYTRGPGTWLPFDRTRSRLEDTEKTNLSHG